MKNIAFFIVLSAFFSPSVLIAQYCSGTTILASSSGSFDDGSGALDYMNNSDCKWLIQPANASFISLLFTSLDLSGADFIKVYDGSTVASPLLAHYDGSSPNPPPGVLTSSGGTMLIHFSSNTSFTDPGWEAEFTSSSTYLSTIFSDTTICFGDSVELFLDSDTILVDQFVFDYTGPININSVIAELGEHYYLKINGDFTGAGNAERRDAAYYYKLNWQNVQIPAGSFKWNGVGNNRPFPDVYNSSHIYYFPFIGDGQSQHFTWDDTNYSDNSGSLQVEVFHVRGVGVWSTGDTSFSVKVSPPSTMTYYVSSIDGNITDSIVVNVINVSSPLSDSISVCNNDSVVLGLDSFSNVRWSTHQFTDSIFAKITDVFYVQMTDTNDCLLNDTINVDMLRVAIEQPDTVICSGDSVSLNVLNADETPLVYFDGVNDFIQVPHSADFLFDRDFTISAWIKPDQTTGFQGIITKVTNHAEKQFSLQLKNDSLVFDYETGGNDFILIHQGISDDWHHIAVSVNASLNVKMYIDGYLVASSIAPAAPVDLLSDLTIGKLGGTYNTNFFQGIIKDAKIWTRTLSDQEILSSLCSHPNPFKEEALLSYWLHSQEQSSYIWDLTLNDLDGLAYGPSYINGKGPCQLGYNYLWSSGQTIDSINIILHQDDTLVLEVSNTQLSCYDSIIINVQELILSIPDSVRVCDYDSLLLEVDSGLSFYSWSNGDSSYNIWASAADTTLILYAEDNIGCANIDTTYVKVYNHPVWQQSDTVICPGLSVDISLVLPYVFDSILWWSGSQNSMQTFVPASDTQFYVNLWSSDTGLLCHFIDTFNIILNSGIGLSDTNLSVCVGDSINIGLSQTFSTYLWNDSSTSPNLEITDTGHYMLYVTDSNFCVDSMSFMVNSFPMPDPIAYDSLMICDLNQAHIYAQDHFLNYQWSHGGNSFNEPIFSVGNYFLTITDTNNCAYIDSAYVGIAVSNATLISHDTLFCKGNQASVFLIDRQSVDSLQWMGGLLDTFQFALLQDTFIYIESWVGDSACYLKDSLFLKTTELVISPNISNVKCNGDSSAFISLNVQGGLGNKYYYWNNGAMSDSLGSLSVGAYSVTVWDSLGCYNDTSFLIDEPSLFYGQLQNSDIICPGDSSGSISLSLFGGTKPYSLNWSNGSVDSVLFNLLPAQYSYVVKDSNNCLISDSVLISSPSDFVFTHIIDHVMCKGQNNAQIQVSLSGGTMPYQYSWNTGNNTSFLPSLSAGVYSLTITDSALCVYDTVLQVNEPDSLDVISDVLNEHCDQSDGYVTLNVSGGTFPYFYSWSNGAQVDTINNLSSGTYSYTITDLNGCVDIDTFIIINRSKPEVDFSFEDVCIGESVSFVGVDTAQTILSWTWDASLGAQLMGDSIDVLYSDTGVYMVELMAVDSFGCWDTVIKTINVYPIPEISLELDTGWGCEYLCVQFYAENSLDTNSSFYWSFEGHSQDSGSVLQYCFDQVGAWDVMLTVVSEYSCTNSVLKADWVYIYPDPVADFSMSQAHVDITQSEIDFWDYSNQAIQWYWDFGDGNQDTVPNPSNLYMDTGYFQVKLVVTSVHTCMDSTFKDIYVEGKNVVYMPNAFTPGRDNVNDEYKPVGVWDDVTSYNFSVWNRWGEMLFESQDPHIGWDGVCSEKKESKCAQGAYVYMLNYLDMKGQMQYLRGSFLLIEEPED